MELVTLEQQNHVARLVINNPRRRNALSRAMWRAIEQYANQLRHNSDARVLTIESSTAGCFAAGADISEFESNYATVESSREVNEEIHRAIDAVQNCQLPSIALINGPCVGGGLALALGCDFRLASDLAKFALTPSRLGLSFHPDDVRRLLDACGRANAGELLFAAQSWSAERGLQAGLVNSVHPAAHFSAYTAEVIQAICANSAAANEVLKQTLNDVHDRNAKGIALAEAAFEALFAAPDFVAGREAFLAKRPVRFPSNDSKE